MRSMHKWVLGFIQVVHLKLSYLKATFHRVRIVVKIVIQWTIFNFFWLQKKVLNQHPIVIFSNLRVVTIPVYWGGGGILQTWKIPKGLQAGFKCKILPQKHVNYKKHQIVTKNCISWTSLDYMLSYIICNNEMQRIN